MFMTWKHPIQSKFGFLVTQNADTDVYKFYAQVKYEIRAVRFIMKTLLELPIMFPS